MKDDAVQITKDHEILEPQDWSFPVPIAYGPGRLSEIGKKCRALGVTRPLIVTDRGSQNLPFISQLKDFLSGSSITSDLFFDISPNPRDDEIASGRNQFRIGGHDAIIAIGSVIRGETKHKCLCRTLARQGLQE